LTRLGKNKQMIVVKAGDLDLMITVQVHWAKRGGRVVFGRSNQR